MTRLILLTFLTICFTTTSNSQCTESAFDFGNNTSTQSYNIQGDVSLTLNTDNTITLNLADNFSTASGPDVRAYLIDSNGMSNLQINQEVHNNKTNGVNTFKNIPIGEINASGLQSFTVTIPTDEDITNYDKILFYCLQFNQFWDIGSFNAFESDNCNVLNTQNFSISSIKIFPNPAVNALEISNIDISNAKIRIFDFYGRDVSEHLKTRDNQKFDVSNLPAGTYFLSIIENQKAFSKKLIIQ